MIVFDGTYRWGPSGLRSRKRRKWMLSCDLLVIDLSLAMPDVVHLKRYLVIANLLTPSPMKTSVAGTLGKRIFRDFGLNSRNVLWIETAWDREEQLVVASFKAVDAYADETDFEVLWRDAMPNEKKLVDRFLPAGWFLCRRQRDAIS